MSKYRPNWSLLAGMSMGLAIVLVAITRASTTPWIFTNLVGFVIVAGGMAAASLIMYPFGELKDLLKCVLACFFRKPTDPVRAIEEIVLLAQMQAEDPLFFSSKADGIIHMRIRDGMELLASGLRNEEIRRRLEISSEAALEHSLKCAGALLSFAKLGPGFGLMGTLLGLVVLLQDMAKEGNFDHVGPALAISLLATLYGVVLSNLVLQPLSELLKNRGDRGLKTDRLIVDGILLLKDKRHPIQIRDALRPHLSWKENLRLNATAVNVSVDEREKAAA